MTSYVAEPLPTQVEATLSEFLARQFQAIQTNFMASMIVPEVRKLPFNAVPGSMFMLTDRDDEFGVDPGLYLFFKDELGDTAWKQVQLNPV
jgi:hypothetical protein